MTEASPTRKYLTVRQASLEEAFMTMTNDSVEYRSTDITDTPTDTVAVTP